MKPSVNTVRRSALFITSALTSMSVILGAPAFAQEEEAQVLDTVQVIGARAMMQSAVEQQRNSDTVASVITRDDIGQFPDQNVAESVRRLPGINILDDQGEGRYVSVRGLDPELNASSLNGVRLPSPEEGTRQVALDVLPSELIQSVSVKKTLTPDMDGDTIGASIEIETTKGFDREDPYLSVKLEGSYNDLSGETTPKGAIDFAYPVSDTFGISGGISYYNRKTSTDNIEMDGWDTENDIDFAEVLEYRDYDVERERIGGSLSFDWKPTANTELYARGVFSRFDDLEKRSRLTIEVDKDSLVSGTDTSAVFSDENEKINVERDLKDRFERQEIQSYQVGGQTQLNDEWEVKYKLAYSHAEEHEYDTQDPTRFRNKFDEDGVEIAFGYNTLEQPVFAVTSGADLFNDPSVYEFDKLEVVDGLSEEDEWAAKIDLERKWMVGDAELSFKTGAKARLKNKTFNLTNLVYDGWDGAADYTLADVLGTQTYGLADMGPVADLGAVRAFNAANFSDFELNQLDSDYEEAAAFYDVDENVTALYAQGRYEEDKLTLVGGLRAELTDTTLKGNTVELVEEDATYNGVQLTEDTLFVTPVEISKDYSDLLPSLNAKYNFNDNLVLRGGVFASVVRPKIGKMAPRFLIEQNDKDEIEAEFGNPDLDPYRAWNFDASAEYYFEQGGVIQVGAFYKRVKDFIVDVSVDNGTFRGTSFDEASYAINGDRATIQGLEFSYQQPLDFLPGLLNGTLVSFNYTYTDAEGTLDDGRVVDLPASSKNTYNAMVGYDKGGLELRLTAAYRDEYLDELGGNAETDRYVKDHLQIDASAKYRINDNFQVFADLVNLNDEPYIAYQKGPSRDRLLQYEDYSYTAKIGVRYTR